MTSKNGGRALRVLISAASAVRRAELERMVGQNTLFHLAGSMTGLAGWEARISILHPDVALVDLAEPHPQLDQLIPPLEHANLAVIMLVDDPQAGWTARALRAGVRGLIARDSSLAELQSAMRAASEGLVLLEPDLVRGLFANGTSGAAEDDLDMVEQLTAREIEVLRLLAEGFGNKEIASRLGISDHTVKFHISSILAKLGAASRTEAVTLGVRKGLILL